jgi:hypothetical protein
MFAAWGGDCAGQGATCTLTMSAARATTASFRPKMNLMFVTSGTINPSTIGSDLAGGDGFCANAAKAALLGGTVWRAWLSTSASTTNITAPAHVGASTTGWILLDGSPFVSSMADLLAGKIYYPPRLTELGTRGSTSAIVTGTYDDGSSAAATLNCSDWTSASGGPLTGRNYNTTRTWTYSGQLGGGCNSMLPIYCFENDAGMQAVPAPTIPAGGRRAFLSKTKWAPSGGLATADTLCQNDATSAGLTGTNFRALLSTSVAATDPSRFDVTGSPWYRLDGAQIVATAGDLAAADGSKLMTSVNLDAAGAYQSGGVWTGSDTAPAATTGITNCTNWSSAAAGVQGWMGYTSTVGLYLTKALYWANNLQDCTVPGPIYCFEK